MGDDPIAAVDDAVFAFMRAHPLHPLTAKLLPQIKENLEHYGEPFMYVGETDQRGEALQGVIDAVNEEQKNGI